MEGNKGQLWIFQLFQTKTDFKLNRAMARWNHRTEEGYWYGFDNMLNGWSSYNVLVWTTSKYEQKSFSSNSIQMLPLTKCTQYGEHIQHIWGIHIQEWKTYDLTIKNGIIGSIPCGCPDGLVDKNPCRNSCNSKKFLKSSMFRPNWPACLLVGQWSQQLCKLLNVKHHMRVQLSVFRWIAIILFSIPSLEMTCVFLAALRCWNLPLNSTQVFSLPPDVVGRGEDFLVLNVTFV